MFVFSRVWFLTWKNLKVYRLRVLLTVIGILFGIVSVTGTFTLNGNASRMVEAEIRKAGEFTLYVREEWGSDRKMLDRHIRELKKYSPAVKDVIPVTTSSFLNITFRTAEESAPMQGVGEGFFAVRNMAIQEGRGFFEQDLRRRTLVVGASLAKRLFGERNAIGQVVSISQGEGGRTNFTVIGVLAPIAFVKVDSDTSPDEMGFVSFPIFRRLEKKPRVQFLVRANSEEDLGPAEEQVRGYLAAFGQEAYKVVDPRAQVKQSRKLIDGIVYSGMTIGFMCLIAGGLGIMNIMLVSVLQRRREIGLYKSIGFTDEIVMLIFISEAVAISLLGCILGVLIGAPAGLVLSSKLLDVPGHLDVKAIILAVTFSLTSGILFGYLPARQASRMDPVEALKG